MKKILFILTLLFAGITVFAQEDDHTDNDRIRDKMREFIQRRLSLSKKEADRFAPVFLRYFREWRQTLRDNADLLTRRQKVVELQIRYRTEFKEIVGEQRSNAIFKEQDGFIERLRKMRQDRLETKPERPKKGLRNLLE